MFRIGIAFPINLTYTALVREAVENFFSPFPDCQLVPLHTPGFPNLPFLVSGKFDALIVRFTEPKHLELAVKNCKTIVNCTQMPSAAPVHTVASDNELVGRMAGRHLLELPAKSVAYYGSSRHDSSPARLKGFRMACAGEKVRTLISETSLENPKPKELIAWLKGLPKPAAVFAFNDYFAAQAANASKALGFDIPGDIRICGVDNDRIAQSWTEVPLTSVDLDEKRIGFRAGEIVHEILLGGKPTTLIHLIPPSGIVVRSSTTREATSNPELNRAIEILKQHAFEDSNIDEIATKAGLCRRKMERLFRDHLNSTPYAEITSIRIKKAKELLQTTHLTIQDIAEQTGFSEARRLCIVFKSHVGVTPTEFRGGEAGRKGRVPRVAEVAEIRRA